LPSFKFHPTVFVRQRFGRNDGNPIVGGRKLSKVDRIIHIDQLGGRKGRLSNDVIEAIPNFASGSSSRPTIGKQAVLSTTQQEIENGRLFVPLNNFVTDARQKSMQDRQGGQFGKLGFQGVQNGAKDGFGIRVTDGIVMQIIKCGLSQQRLIFLNSGIIEFGNLPIVSKRPVNSPQFSCKGMDVLQTDATSSSIANVGNHVL
jgi:hypothetical protein